MNHDDFEDAFPIGSVAAIRIESEAVPARYRARPATIFNAELIRLEASTACSPSLREKLRLIL